MAKLQYADGIAEVVSSGGQCPPEDATESIREAWRFAFNPIAPEGFEPVAVKNPRRLLNAEDANTRCSCWALSMYDSEPEARRAFKHFVSSFKNFGKLVGDHLAVGQLDHSCGQSTESDRHGHFDLHPYMDANLASKFQLTGSLP